MSVLLFIPLFNVYSQKLEVTLETEKNMWQFDSIVVTYKIKNTGNDTAYLKLDESYTILYKSEENFHSNHCWKISPHQTWFFTNKQPIKEFVTINPGEEYIKTEALDIGWVCRNALPMEELKFEISYHRIIRDADNFYLFGNPNSRRLNIWYIDAWVGMLKSNTIEITINP